MTDDITEKLELRRRQYASIAHARCSRLLRGQELKLDDDTIPLILNLIDSFVSQSQGNKRVKILTLCPYSVDGSDDVFWDKVGQAVGNLQALEALHISGHHNNNEDYSVSFSAPEVRQADESTLALSESLTELLRLPTLRLVRFNNFSFTPALFQATANAFMEGTAVTELEFMVCSFSAVECDFMMANGFSRIASVTSIIAHKCKNTIALVDALAAVLPLNSTLRHLELGQRSDDDPGCLSPLFLALGHNTGLKTLTIFMQGSAEDSLCTAINVGLRMNETLESLRLYSAPLSDDNADSWCSAFSFLRTNKTLKSLGFYVRYGLTESCLSAFRIDIAVMLEDNASLGSLSIQAVNSSKMKAQDYVAFVTALKHNGTLKTLILQPHFTIQLTDDEDKHVAKFLKKNYALESVPGIDLENRAGDVGAILRLNAAGRRHLVQDGSSISKGVKVLSSVNDDNNCVFLHLLENPRLCDRTAVELPDADESSSHSTSPTAIYSSGGEKREQDILHGGKESRRRLA